VTRLKILDIAPNKLLTFLKSL